MASYPGASAQTSWNQDVGSIGDLRQSYRICRVRFRYHSGMPLKPCLCFLKCSPWIAFTASSYLVFPPVFFSLSVQLEADFFPSQDAETRLQALKGTMDTLGNVLEKVNGSGSTGNSTDNNLDKVQHWRLLSIKRDSAFTMSTSPYRYLSGSTAEGMAVGMAKCKAD